MITLTTKASMLNTTFTATGEDLQQAHSLLDSDMFDYLDQYPQACDEYLFTLDRKEVTA